MAEQIPSTSLHATSHKPDVNPDFAEFFEQMITESGGDPDSLNSALVREIMHTAIKLVRDDADTAELKVISRSLKELRYAYKVFRQYEGIRKVSIFGSARTPEDHATFKACVDFSRQIVDDGWMVITGAGPGIMHAGHAGSGKQASFGVAIRLPFEATANEVIEGDPKLIVFRYFFTRKLIFMSQSHAIALFPGGFGTQDEGYEALTLIQTGKAPLMPIVMIDEPGGTYWKEWDRYTREHLLANKLISPDDLRLYYLTDDPADAARHIEAFYRNYHSQRFVRDTLVMRLNHKLSDTAMAALNEEFGDLVTRGAIEQGPALPQEDDFLNRPRLYFHFRKSAYGRLRLMIDRINELSD